MVENPILVDTHGTIGSHKALEIQIQDATSKILSSKHRTGHSGAAELLNLEFQ